MNTAAEDSTKGRLDRHPAELLKRALAFGLEIEDLLEQAGRPAGSFRLRLARAHVLSAIDALTELVREHPTRPSDVSPGNGVYAVLDDGAELLSGACSSP